MTDFALNRESKVQSFAKPNPIAYENIATRGSPFVTTHRLNVNDPNLRNEVHFRSVGMGEPVVVEGLHKHEAWRTELFPLQHLHKDFGNTNILCADPLSQFARPWRTISRMFTAKV